MVSTAIYRVPNTVLDTNTPRTQNKVTVLVITVTNLDDNDGMPWGAGLEEGSQDQRHGLGLFFLTSPAVHLDLKF